MGKASLNYDEQEEILRHLSSVLNISKYIRSGTKTQCNNSVVLIHAYFRNQTICLIQKRHTGHKL